MPTLIVSVDTVGVAAFGVKTRNTKNPNMICENTTMNKMTWRVILRGKWVGYVVSPTERHALQKAQEKYGFGAIIQPLTV